MTDSRSLISVLLALLILGSGSVALAGKPVIRTIELRDGSVLRIPVKERSLTFTRLNGDGTTQKRTVKLSAIDDLILAAESKMEKVQQFDRLIEELGGDSYKEREGAQKKLAAMVSEVRVNLEDLLKVTDDPELKWRIRRLLHDTPIGDEKAGARFEVDELVMVSGEKMKGDTGKWTLEGKFHNLALTLGRKNVRRISKVPPDKRPELTVAPEEVRTRRILNDTPREFPAGLVSIDFESDGAGRHLNKGDNIEKRFVSKGIVLSTSIKGAYVSVNSYNVRGRSRGKSCATHRPLWQGTITIRFCVPGQENVPAGVHKVGLWIAAVSPNGTWMDAYDRHDKHIARAVVDGSSNDFLALASNIPIAYIKVVPNPDIDRDYTIDDLMFTPPRPLGVAADTSRFLVTLHGGDKVLCRQLVIDGDTFIMTGTQLRAEAITLPRALLEGVVTPADLWKTEYPAGGVYAMLDGGWIVAARIRDKALSCEILEHLPAGMAAPGRLVAISAVTVPFREPPKNSRIPEGGVAVVGADGAKVMGKWEFSDRGVVTIDLDADKFKEYAESDVPMLWFRPEQAVPAGAHGVIQMLNGERYVIDGKKCRLISWNGQHLVLKCERGTYKVRVDAIRSLTLPGPGK